MSLFLKNKKIEEKIEGFQTKRDKKSYKSRDLRLDFKQIP
jgi:hypothetical protein